MKSAILLILIGLQIISCKNPVKEEVREISEKPLSVVKVIEKEKNIFVIYSDESMKQLTFNESDNLPIYIDSKNQVLFIRDRKENNGNRQYVRKEIMSVDIDNLKESLITETKPYKDGLDNTFEILNVSNPTLSLDQDYLYFSTEKWVTSSQLVKVNLETGKWTELFGAGYFELIENGDYKGNFIISKSEIRDEGRASYYMIVNESGEILKEFANEDAMFQFKKGNIE